MDINGAEILDGFVLGHFAAQYAQQLGKGFLANLLNGLIAGNDQTGVQVHIIFHALVGIGVAADLDDRHAGEALRGTAAGREHHELGARGSHAGQNLRLTARRILDPQAFLVGNMLRVFQHALDGAGAALDDGTKALFLNTGKTAGDVTRCGGQPAQGKVKERAMERRPIKTIRNQVYQILKDDICEGRFAPGQWLQENELAERLCVSRSPIREALRQLASDGLVVEIPNKGVFVKEFTARDIEEIFDLRVLLEDYAISKLQHHLTTADMQQLIDCLNEMERLHAQKNLRAYTDMDSKLHGLLIELCGNSLLESMYARIHSLNQQFRIYSLTSTQRFNESMEEHRDIVHCLLTNNADEARAINKRHLQLAKDKIIQHFSEQEALKQAADAQPKTTAEADKKAK